MDQVQGNGAVLDQPLYDEAEARRVLHMSHGEFWKRVSRGNLGSIKIGRRRLVTAQQIADFIQRHVDEAEMAKGF